MAAPIIEARPADQAAPARRPIVQYVLSGYPPAAGLEAYPEQVGGAEMQARRVALLLADEFEVRVVAERPRDKRAVPLLDDPGVTRVTLTQHAGSRRALEAVARLTAAGLREPRPSVVQTSQLNGIAVAAALLAGLRRVPLIIKIAGRANLDDATAGKRRVQLDLLVHWAAAIVAPSENTISAALARSIPERKLYLIPNGVDTDYFRPADRQGRMRARMELGYAEDDMVFCWVGRLNRYKGLDCVLPVWGEVHAQRPQARLLLVGEGEQAQIAQRLVDGHPDSVQWVGFRSDVRPIYAAADFIFLTSPSEGLSNVLLEGLASGVPAVVSSAPENVEVGAGGDFLLPFDRESRVSQLRTLMAAIDSKSRWAELARASRRRAEEAYGIEITAARWRGLYRRLLSRRG